VALSVTDASPGVAVRVLAVDDDPKKLLALTALLSELGQEVVTATSGREALRRVLREDFAVILLDVNMPGMDGFETAALIRQRRTSEHTPIIFVTSYGDETHASRGYSLGAVDYILAPVQPDVLKTKVGVFVDLYRKAAQIRSQADALEHRAAILQRLTEAALAINSVLSLDRILQVLADRAREIFAARQAVVLVAPEMKWSETRSAVSLDSAWSEERRILRDRGSLLALLSRVRGTLRLGPAAAGADADLRALLVDEVPVEAWLVAPLTTGDGRPMGVLHVLGRPDTGFAEEDEAVVTQLAQIGSIAIENTLNAEAREANRIKDEFLTTLSHELRTPLSAILGWTRTLRTAPFDAAQAARGLEVIERNVLAQARLIDDLLDVSRIITGKLRLSVRKVSLIRIVEAVLETMRPAAEAKEIRVTFLPRLREEQDAIVGDPDRLQQVVWNLLSNAIKFTPPRGRVDVLLTCEDSRIAVSVTDTGRGIEEEFLAHVFDRFRQADSSTTRSQAGLGIGLAIARHLTELHGGSIRAESAGPGRGATFRVELPVVAIVPDVPSEVPPLPPTAFGLEPGDYDLHGLSILVVEDEPDCRELIVETLHRAGARVFAARSSAEGFAALEEHQPDILVSDIGMPGEDGLGLLRRIRERPADRGGRTPAVAVSAYARVEDRTRSLAAGFQAHVPKPFEPVELLRVVSRWAPHAHGGVRSPAAAPSGEASRAAGEGAVSVLVVEDDPDARDGLRRLLEEWGHSADVACDGREALERIRTRSPSVALIDIGLPEMDGYELARRIRDERGAAAPLLVALTGHASAEDRARALASGFDAHLAKPIDFSRLSSLLASRSAV
jgi:CheY-like chemotaxis protein